MKRANTAMNLKEQEMERKFYSVNWLFMAKGPENFEKKGNRGINEQQNMMKAIFHPMKTFFSPWMQFS